MVPKSVIPLRLSYTYMCKLMRPSSVQIMACHLFGTKPLSEPMFTVNWIIWSKIQWYLKQNTTMNLKMLSAKWRPFHLSLNVLTHCGLVTPYGNMELGQHWLRYWLVAWRHQAITWTNVDLFVRSHGIHLRGLSLDDVKIPINKTRLKIAVLKWHPGLPRANELKHWGREKMDAISQTTFASVFSWIKMFEFWLIFYWSFS